MTAGQDAPREPARAQLGHIGSFGLRLDPVITLIPDPPGREFLLTGTRTPKIELTGSCKNLSGRVPCTITWIIQRDVDRLAQHDKQATSSAEFERDDPRNRKLWLESTGAGRYRVMLASDEWSPRSGTSQPSGLTWKVLDSLNVLELGLLGKGSLGYRLQPDTPVCEGELQPSAGFRFDNAIEFETNTDASIGMELQIMPIRYPDWLAHESVRITIYNGDGGGDSWSFRDMRLGDRQSWWFGCNPHDTSQTSHAVAELAYHDHYEGDAQLNYGARVEAIDNKTGKKETVVASLELPNRWSAPVPVLASFQLEPKVEDGSLELWVSATFTGFHPSIEVPFTIELWAVNDERDARPASDVLALPLASGTRMMWNVVAKSHHAEHHFSEQLLHIDGAHPASDEWRFFAEMHLRSTHPTDNGTPFCQIARFKSPLSGVDQGVLGRALTASGVATRPVSLSGLDRPDSLSCADQLDACIMAACIWAEARKGTQLEMAAIGGTIMNRVRSRKWDGPGTGKRYATAYARVVLAPDQFLYFSAKSAPDHKKLTQALEAADAAGDRAAVDTWASTLETGSADRNAWQQALDVATRLIRSPQTNPVDDPPDTMHFYSLISMGKKQPAWAKDSAEVQVSGISKERFRFFHGVK